MHLEYFWMKKSLNVKKEGGGGEKAEILFLA
jgi:hypothetical protein